MSDIISISQLDKIYEGGFQALKKIDLTIREGEIFALLGPNGAGKTTLISTICGIVSPSSGQIEVAGYDVETEFRQTRSLIGLVPQELTTDAFESVWNTICFSRGLFGKKKDPAYLEKILKSLTLWDKKDNMIMTLSGGMKRRVLIAKALSHEPQILFLDEPTAGVDVELRKEMWDVVRALHENGVTIILTTHYIEEAEMMADRIAVINNGEIVLVEKKQDLMHKLGKKQLILDLEAPLTQLPSSLSVYDLNLSDDQKHLIYTYESRCERTGITGLLNAIAAENIKFTDLHTHESSLEDIFVQLVNNEQSELELEGSGI